MICFLDEEKAYLNWVTHHRTGFVLACQRDPLKGVALVHRASCPLVKHSDTKRTRWTTGRFMKCCALDIEPLTTWAKMRSPRGPTECAECMPRSSARHASRLTKLDREIIDYVLEIAAIALDADGDGYELTVSMIANYLNKTAGQLAAGLDRLLENGLLEIIGSSPVRSRRFARSHVFPTVKALQLLEYYQGFDDQQLTAESEKLTNSRPLGEIASGRRDSASIV